MKFLEEYCSDEFVKQEIKTKDKRPKKAKEPENVGDSIGLAGFICSIYSNFFAIFTALSSLVPRVGIIMGCINFVVFGVGASLSIVGCVKAVYKSKSIVGIVLSLFSLEVEIMAMLYAIATTINHQ